VTGETMTANNVSLRNGNRSLSREAGVTMIELMIAVVVLGISLLGSLSMVLMGMQSNSRNKTDTTATILDQEIVEKFSTLKKYPKPGWISIYDCALNTGAANIHRASLGAGAGPTGNGATLFTAANAPSTAQAGDVDWTAAAPTLATSTTAGYAMEYQTCHGDTYEVRWNIMEVSPNPSSRISMLTVSARPRTALSADAAQAQNRAVLFAWPVTLRTLIEN
jgi:prepilin-type N-terminal cleavage/methylation domain-containing protein